MVEDTINVIRKAEHKAEHLMDSDTKKTEEEKTLEEARRVTEQAAMTALHTTLKWGHQAANKASHTAQKWGENLISNVEKEVEK